MPPAHVLIVEDDTEIATLLAQYLGERGHVVSTAADGTGMDAALAATACDIVLLDIMLPGESGLSLCQRVRASQPVGIIMVTALTEPTDRVAGLDAGADDYVCKPFDLEELEARIRALIRRRDAGAAPGADVTLHFADHQFQPQRRLLRTPAGIRVSLTGAETDLLLAFCQHPQAVLSREQLIEWTRGEPAVVPGRVIDLLVSRLRRKLSPDGPASEFIQTARTGGYLFRHPVLSR